MSMPTPLKPKDKRNSIRIKMVNYLVLYSQNFKITFLTKLELYSCHHGRRVHILFLPFFCSLYPNESKK